MKRDDLNKNYENKNSTKQVCDIDPNYYKIIAEEYVAIYCYRSIIDESQMHYNGKKCGHSFVFSGVRKAPTIFIY